MLSNVLNRAKYVVSGEEGASMVELMVWFAVVMAVGGVLLLIKNTVTDYLTDTNTELDKLDNPDFGI